MILSDKTIRRRLNDPMPGDDPFIIEPFHERTVHNGMSFGLSCAGYDLRVKVPLHELWVYPGDFVLVTTIERLAFPYDVLGQLTDKSTWARRGIAVQNTIFEPGWRGYPTIEISNHGPDTVKICTGDPIAQMIFFKVDQPVANPYRGKYQDQQQKAVPAMEEA